MFLRLAFDLRVNPTGEELIGTLLFDLADPGYVSLLREKMEGVIEEMTREGKVKIYVDWEETSNGLKAYYRMYDFKIPAGKARLGNGVHIEVKGDSTE